jgi:hypothetical protein
MTEGDGSLEIPSHARVPPIIYFGVITFITLQTGAAASAWPLAAPAQQPVVGFLRSTTSADSGHLVAAFCQSLKKPTWSRVRTARSNTAGPRINLIDYRRWPPICYAGPWQRGFWRKAGSPFDEGQCPSDGPRCGHQYDRGCEHQTQQTE